MTVSGALTVLSIIAVGLRFSTRRQQKSRYLADDWIALLALVGSQQMQEIHDSSHSH